MPSAMISRDKLTTRLFVYHYHFLHNRPSPFKKTQHKVNTSTSRGLWFLYDGHQAAFLPHLCVPLADRGAGTDHHTHPPSPHPESRLVVENDIFKIISIYSLYGKYFFFICTYFTFGSDVNIKFNEKSF